MKRAVIALAVACSAPAPRPRDPDPIQIAPDAATVVAPPQKLDCMSRIAADWRGSSSFLESPRIVHLKVTRTQPGPTLGNARCVTLALDVVDTFRGSSDETRLEITIHQSTIEHYTSRPAGPWWVIEQPLAAAGEEYVAFCPEGPLGTNLVGSCTVAAAAPLLPDLRLVRDAEAAKLALPALIAKLRGACATASHIAPEYVWHRSAALQDPKAFEAIVGVLLVPACSNTARGTLLNLAMFSTVYDSSPHVHILARAMFELLQLTEAKDFHGNLVGTWLPNLLGIEGAGPKYTAAQIFGTDRKARSAAMAKLATLGEPAAKLLAWIR